MNNNFKMVLVLLILGTTGMLTQGLNAQDTRNINPELGTMKLSGTSTMHDWDMVGQFHIDGKFKMTESTNKLNSLSALNFVLPVENLKSDKKKLNETAYKALKTDQFKEITFKMTHATVTEVLANRYKVVALGLLTIAGVTRTISLEVLWIMGSDRTVLCAGTQKLKMSDYNVEPPSFLGFMKTGDDISLNFEFKFKT